MWEAWYDVALAPNSGPWRNWRRVLVRPCDGGCGRKVAAYIDDAENPDDTRILCTTCWPIDQPQPPAIC